MKPKPDNAPRSKLLGYSTGRTPKTGGGLAERFEALLERCDKEAGSLNVAQLTSHAAFQEIVSMGEDVVPLLLGGLEGGEPENWFGALQKITGVDPVSPASRGNPKSMAQDWLRWGRERGVMPSCPQPAACAPDTSVHIAAEGGKVLLRTGGPSRLSPDEAERTAARLVDAARIARQQQGSAAP